MRRAAGGPRASALRDVRGAVQHMAAARCQWTVIPNGIPSPRMHFIETSQICHATDIERE